MASAPEHDDGLDIRFAQAQERARDSEAVGHFLRADSLCRVLRDELRRPFMRRRLRRT